MTGGVTVRTFTWTIWRSPAFTGCPCPLHRRAISCCAALARSVANHAAIYCGNGELLHHLPEQLSKRERYSEKWQRRTHSVGVTALARICLHGDLQRFGRRLSLYVNTAAEAIRALSLQVPGFRRQMNEGWYQIRIRGEDTAPEAVYARLHEPLGEGRSSILCRDWPEPKGVTADCAGGAAASWALSSLPGHHGVMGQPLSAGGLTATTMLFSLGASMILGGVAQMLAPKAKTPDYRATDNGKQNTYFSSLDNMIAQGNPMPVPYGEMLLVHDGYPRTSAPVMRAETGKWWLSGGDENKKIPQS